MRELLWEGTINPAIIALNNIIYLWLLATSVLLTSLPNPVPSFIHTSSSGGWSDTARLPSICAVNVQLPNAVLGWLCTPLMVFAAFFCKTTVIWPLDFSVCEEIVQRSLYRELIWAVPNYFITKCSCFSVLSFFIDINSNPFQFRVFYRLLFFKKSYITIMNPMTL